ncbi:MAG: DUF2238 domain-containing protein [Acidimicrobiales bacterium]
MLEVSRAHPRLAACTLVYLFGFLTAGILVGSDLAIPYALVIGTLVVLVAALERRVDLGPGVLWALAAWGSFHMAGGVIPIGGGRTLYNAWLLPGHLLRYDQAVHAFGFGYATLACGKVLRRWLPDGRVGAGPAAMVVLAGMGVGALNEVFEFFATLVLEDTNVGGYDNTGWDLVADLVGALAAAAWLTTSSRRESSEGGVRSYDGT